MTVDWGWRRRIKVPSVEISIKFEAATRKEGKVWLAWCPPIDVITQSDTKENALKSLSRRRNLSVTDIQSALEGPARAAGEPNVR